MAWVFDALFRPVCPLDQLHHERSERSRRLFGMTRPRSGMPGESVPDMQTGEPSATGMAFHPRRSVLPVDGVRGLAPSPPKLLRGTAPFDWSRPGRAGSGIPATGVRSTRLPEGAQLAQEEGDRTHPNPPTVPHLSRQVRSRNARGATSPAGDARRARSRRHVARWPLVRARWGANRRPRASCAATTQRGQSPLRARGSAVSLATLCALGRIRWLPAIEVYLPAIPHHPLEHPR